MLSLFVRRTCAVNFAVLATAVAGVLLTSAGPARAQQASGSITIIKTAVGLNGAFSFTSSVAGGASFSLTTANGTASRTFGNLTPGSYSFTEAGLPPEWTLTSLSCAGDTGRTPTTVNLGNRTATIGLDAGEAITCTFTNTFGEQRHRAQTRQVIANFLEHRLSLLIGQGPDQLSFLRRVPSSLWGNSSGDGGSSQPLSFTGTTTAFGERIDFSASFAQMMRAQAGGVLGYAKMPANAKPRIIPEPVINAWVEAHYASLRSSNGGVDNDGQFGVVYLGADYLVTPNILVGALVQFDWMKENSNSLSSAVDGHGTMGGPYISLRLSPDIFFDSRFAWGISANTVNPFGYYTDAFSTERWLAHAKLTGNWRWGDFRVTPSVAIDYAQERQHEYTDTLGVLIAGQTVSLGRLSFGPEIARRFTGAGGIIYEPMASLIGQWDFSKTEVIGLNGLPADSERLHAKAQAGLQARAPNGFSARIAASYDGIGSSSLHAIGAEIWLSIPFN
jgi:hypothetical protein